MGNSHFFCVYITVAITALSGCEHPPNNNLEIQTGISRVVHGGKVVTAPLGLQPVAGQWVADIPTSSTDNVNHIAPFGNIYTFSGVTSPLNTITISAASLTGDWPTILTVNNARLPGYWNFQWQHPPNCINQIPPYTLLPNQQYRSNAITLPSLRISANPAVDFDCFTNSPANPDFIPANISPQFVLDDALPPTLQVAAFAPLVGAMDSIHLHVFSTKLDRVSLSTALSTVNRGTSAVFPYPRDQAGNSLGAGAYITTVTEDTPTPTQETKGMEPFYIGHNEKSYPGAFGVAVANPTIITTYVDSPVVYGDGTCAGSTNINSTTDGGERLLVTLLNQNQVVVGDMSHLVQTGIHPTVVIPFNFDPPGYDEQTSNCSYTHVEYHGAHSALVVNTGSDDVTVIDLLNAGGTLFPSGTIHTGARPVAATVIGTKAYVVNYEGGSLVELDLLNLSLLRSMNVMSHPTSITKDSNGNLWVGGQGSIVEVNPLNLSQNYSIPIDGTTTGLAYDASQGRLIQTLLQNGTASAPSLGTTQSQPIVFSLSGPSSYSATSRVSIINGASNLTSIVSDSMPYTVSPLASSLAFPGQTAFTPPVVATSSGDVMASVNGTSFTVSVVATGQVLITGILPFPARGVALTQSMLYFTMPETNSVVTLPIKLP